MAPVLPFENRRAAATAMRSRDFILAKSRLVRDALFPRRQSLELCRRAVLRFKRRTGQWCFVPGNPSQRPLLSRRCPDFAKRIGRHFTVSFATADIPLLMHRTWSKVSSLNCLNKTRWAGRIARRDACAHFSSDLWRIFCITSTIARGRLSEAVVGRSCRSRSICPKPRRRCLRLFI